MKQGYTNIDAVDGCAEMLDKAATKNIFNRMLVSMIDANRLDIEDGE